MERQRQSIPIQGINRAESDDTVKDGACEDIYNFRYRAGVFENVSQPLLLHQITQSDGFSIVHRLDAMDQGEYLAEKEGALWRVKIADGTVTGLEKITVLPGDAADTRYFHFGNVLYVNYTQGGGLQELVFRYKERKFTRVDFATVAPPAMRISCEYKSAAKVPLSDENDGAEGAPSSRVQSVKIARIERYASNPAANKEEFFYNVGVNALTEEGFTTGTAYVFAAYKLFDGSIIKPSCLQIISADCNKGKNEGSKEYLYKSFISGEKWLFYGRVAGVKPTITVEVPDVVRNNSLVECVVIYSTRNIPTYNYERVYLDFAKEGYPAEDIGASMEMNSVYKCSHGCIWNKDLDEITGPFYEVADIDFRAGESSVTLTYDEHFKNIEHFPVYAPNYSCHNTISKGKYDYNDRLHIFGLKTELFKDAKAFVLPDEPKVVNGMYECFAEYTLQVDGETHIVRSTEPGHAWSGGDGTIPTHYLYNLLSYPDSRATKVDIWVREKNPIDGAFRTKKHVQYKLKSSPSINFSYAQIERAGNYVPVESLFTDYSDKELTTVLNDVVESQNKIQVSYPSNPFVYAPSNIYTVGGQGERIREIIATAERMTEVAYGYQPLLVFTNRATYALESGEGEVLYARNIPILSQSIVEGTNAVEGNGAVFFVSTSGVTAIVRGQISNISEQMRRWAGLIASDATLPDFEKYIRAARLMFNRNESELIVYNPSYSYAYVYSLMGKYWTRREWDASVEPCFGEIVTVSGVASLFEEDPERPASSCKLVTRPLKLGSLEYTRLETLAARIRWGEGSRFTLSIEGSDDAMRWVPLRAESNQPSVRRTPSSFRYHRIQLTGNVADCLAITHFDVEFYNKFVHRLR